MLERKKVKSWLKSVSAFANTEGGSLFYGVNDEGEIVGLENVQADADFISEMIKARLDPVPEVQLIPIEHEGRTLLEVKVKAGVLTPYYYYQDGTRTAFVRVGNESVECNSQQLLSLVLKGTHMTWDSLPTQVDASKHSFIILALTENLPMPDCYLWIIAPCFNPAYSVPVGRGFIKMMPSAPWSIVPILCCF